MQDVCLYGFMVGSVGHPSSLMLVKVTGVINGRVSSEKQLAEREAMW